MFTKIFLYTTYLLFLASLVIYLNYFISGFKTGLFGKFINNRKEVSEVGFDKYKSRVEKARKLLKVGNTLLVGGL